MISPGQLTWEDMGESIRDICEQLIMDPTVNDSQRKGFAIDIRYFPERTDCWEVKAIWRISNRAIAVVRDEDLNHALHVLAYRIIKPE